MKIRRKNEQPLATREFTDREEPRAAFWNKYNSFKTEMADGNVRVISYYGIGGIGKSSLLKKLRCEMDERIKSPRYVDYNFEVSTEPKSVLEALRHILQDKYHFSFTLFDLGIYAYARKIGLNPKLPEIKAFIERSPILGLLGAGLDIVDFAGFARKVLSFADKAVALVRNHLLKHKEELSEIENMEAADLYAYLPYLFSCDMVTNLENAAEPLVIFLDTYEKLVNEFAATGDTLERDEWLRGEDGLIRNMPNTLWVIGGREKLKWEQFDPEWSEALEQHIVGNLSEADGISFLKKSGVSPDSLCKELYGITHGTPVYLDFCVDRFIAIRDSGETPDVSLFGKDVRQLVTRFAQYMDDAKRDFVYMLAHLGTFDDKLVERIAPAIIPSFSISSYERIKGFSFINSLGDGRYVMHQTVGEILLADGGEAVRLIGEKVKDAVVPYCIDVLDTLESITPEYTVLLEYMKRFAPDSEDTVFYEFEYAGLVFIECRYDESLSLYKQAYEHSISVLGEEHPQTIEIMSQLFAVYGNMALAGEAKEIGEKAIDLTKKVFGENSAETLDILIKAVSLHCSLAEYDDALKYGEEAYKISTVLPDISDESYIFLLNSLAIVYNCFGRNEDALVLNIEALDAAKETGDMNTVFVSANSAVNSFFNLGRFEEAHKYAIEATEAAKIAYGKEHPNTYIAMSNLARAKSALGEDEKALEIYKDILPKFTKFYDEDNILTITLCNQSADVMEKLGDTKNALEINKTLLPLCISAVGEEHPTTQKIIADIERLS
ncbi:MAG: tetratricopeptide repeat protein [Clostridia bacterium]|nr:tetratricopeptide repeat protein [Clostridia bacterium]